MASNVDIVNSALNQLGEAAITDFTDDSRAGRLANRSYDDLREGLLRDHPWNFAMKRASLPALAEAPEWEFDYAYLLPSDCLRIIGVDNEEKLEYRIERQSDSTVIVTDIAPEMKIKYTADVDDPSKMDPKFREALAARLMVDWAEPLTGMSAKVSQSSQLYVQKLREAKVTDGQEDSVLVVTSDEWIGARY